MIRATVPRATLATARIGVQRSAGRSEYEALTDSNGEAITDMEDEVIMSKKN